MQSALNDRFNTLFSWRFLFNFEKLTPENVGDASKETISILHSQLNSKFEKWKEFSADLISALDARFAAEFPTDKLSETQVRNYHMLFATKPECWGALAKARQQVLRQEFDKYSELKQLRVNMW